MALITYCAGGDGGDPKKPKNSNTDSAKDTELIRIVRNLIQQFQPSLSSPENSSSRSSGDISNAGSSTEPGKRLENQLKNSSMPGHQSILSGENWWRVRNKPYNYTPPSSSTRPRYINSIWRRLGVENLLDKINGTGVTPTNSTPTTNNELDISRGPLQWEYVSLRRNKDGKTVIVLNNKEYNLVQGIQILEEQVAKSCIVYISATQSFIAYKFFSAGRIILENSKYAPPERRVFLMSIGVACFLRSIAFGSYAVWKISDLDFSLPPIDDSPPSDPWNKRHDDDFDPNTPPPRIASN